MSSFRQLERDPMAGPIPKLHIGFLAAAKKGILGLLKSIVLLDGHGRLFEKAYERVVDRDGRNALHLSAGAGHIRVCKFLVEELNYSLDFGDDEGYTPLHKAILNKHPPTAVYLIEKGAGIECATNQGYTALHCAAEQGPNEILRLLLSKGAKLVPDKASWTPLQSACSFGKKDTVKLFLDNGADPNLSSKDDYTPLMLSILAGSYECLELLLKAGADPNFASSMTTPLVLAADKGDTRFLDRLLKARADPNVVEARRLMTPLEVAAMNSKLPAVKALFPCTSRIPSFPDWSIDGIMKHINSKEVKAQRYIRNKEHAELSKAKGREAFNRKAYVNAIHWYSQAINADPTDAAVFANRSLCGLKMKLADKALQDAKACVALKPDWSKAHYREGSARMLHYEYSKASDAFAKALKLDPNNKDIQKAQREAEEAKLHGW